MKSGDFKLNIIWQINWGETEFYFILGGGGLLNFAVIVSLEWKIIGHIKMFFMIITFSYLEPSISILQKINLQKVKCTCLLNNNTVTQCRLLQSYFPYATIRHFLKTVFKYNVLPETLSRGPSDLTLTSMWDCPGMAWSSGLFSPLPRDTSEAIPWK